MPEIHGGEDVVVIGEAPGEDEVDHGRPFVGRSGKELMLWLEASGLGRPQVALGNAILCRPPGNNLERLLADVQRARTAAVKVNQQRRKQGLPPLALPLSPLEACRPQLVRTLLAYPYALVVGSKAYQSIRGGASAMRHTRGAFQELVAIAEDGNHDVGALRFVERSSVSPEVLTYGTVKLVPTFHPAFVLRKLAARYLTLRDVNRLVRWRAGQLDWPDVVRVERNPSPARLREYLYGAGCAPHHGIDVETRGIDPLVDLDLRTLAIADRDGGVVIHFRSIDGRTFLGDEWDDPERLAPFTDLPPVRSDGLGFRGWYSPADAREVRAILKQFLSDPTKQKIGHNWNYFDEEVIQTRLGVATWTWAPLAQYPLDYDGLIPGMVWDTICGTRADHSELPRDLYTLGTRLTDVPAWKSANEEKVATSTRSDGDLATYNVIDSMVTDRVGVKLLTSVRARGVAAPLNIDFRMQHIMRETRRMGMCIHEEKRLAKEEELVTERRIHRAAIQDAVGSADFNPQSINQMEELFFKALALPPLSYSERTGRPTLDDGTLRAYRRMPGIPTEVVDLIDHIRRFRKVSKELATFVLPLRLRTDLRPNAKGEMVGGLTLPPAPGHRWGRVHPHFSVHGPGTHRRSSSSPNCFPGDTEILTRSGWVPFARLLQEHRQGVTHQIAQWDAATGAIDFALPVAYHQHDYAGPLVRFEHQSASLQMTPNHEIPLRHRNGRSQRVTAANLDSYRGDWQTHHAGQYAGGGGLALSPAELQFLVMLQADGSYHTTGCGLDFGFVKPRKIERFRAILAALGWDWRDYTTDRRFRAYIPYTPRIRAVCAYLGSAKQWGAWLLDLTRAQIDVVLAEVWQWDAVAERQSQYGSKDPVNADWIQTLLVLTGVRANQRQFTNVAGASIRMVDVRRTTTNTITHKAHWSAAEWAGQVYCVTMPLGTIVVRHHGRVTITHQSHNIPKHLRALFVPDEGNVFIGADYDQIELRLISGIAGVKAYLVVFREGGDPHATTAFLIYGDVFEQALKASLTPDQWAHYKRTGSPPKADHGTPMYETLRRFAKTFVYAVIYGGTARTIFASVSAAEDPKTGDLLFPTMTYEDVKFAYDTWMSNAPEVPTWWREIEQFCRVHGYVREPIMGTIRDFPEYSPTEVPNMPIQGGAAKIMARGMCRLRDRIAPDFFNYRGIVSEVHDAVTVECEDRPSVIAETQDIVGMALTQTFAQIPGVDFTATPSKPAYTWKDA